MKRAGLAGRDLHVHDLRGTVPTRFYVAGLAPREIAEAMGWSEDKVERLIDRHVKRDEILERT
jgi:DNA-directed RNA polymerase specialized sigma24 family protein